MAKIIKVFIAAGEPSSDTLGQELIDVIMSKTPNAQIQFVGGSNMINAANKQSLIPQSDIAVMGYVEVLTKIFKIKRHIKKTAQFLQEFKPDIYIAIDSRGFNLRVIEAYKKLCPNNNTLFYNYVSPSIWAYRYNRIFAIKRHFHHQFVLYPFEKQYYDKESIPCTYIGHHLGYAENVPSVAVDNNQIALLPGSRVQEIKTLLPIFLSAANKLIDADKLKISIITLPHLKGLINKILAKHPGNKAEIISSPANAASAIASCAGIITKSGTVSIELMRYNKPTVVAHKINPITAFFVKKVFKQKYVSIGNIMAGKMIIPELLQEKCNGNDIAHQLQNAMQNQVDYAKYLQLLRNYSGLKPAELAWQTILSATGQ